MRIFLGEEDEEVIESDSRFSKANYGSRKKFSIETAILEKRLIFDNSILSNKHTIYNLTDLQFYYDQQLANIRSIVEEAVERDWQVIKLFTKVMLNFKYYICISYGVSNTFYRGENYKLAGTRQGNKFSRDMYRDISYLIIK